MSIEKITSKIIKEAEDERDALLKSAEEKRDVIIAEAKAKAGKLIESEQARGLIEKDKIISRRKSVADIDCRKVVLEKKQELIAECFEKAIEKIVSMNENDYLDFLVDLGKSTGVKDGVLVLNETDRAKIGDKFVARLSEEVGGKFILADETGKMRGGFMLKTGDVYINNTVEALVDESKEQLGSRIAAILF